MITKLFETFETLHTTSGRNAKRAVIAEVLTDERLKAIATEILQATYDPMVTYGVTVSKSLVPPSSPVSMGAEALMEHWGTTKSLLHDLSRRRITGSAAKQAVTNILSPLTADEQKWFIGIFNRNLRIAGVSTTTWSEFIDGLENPVSPQLCVPYDGSSFNEEWFAEEKLDGIRCLLVWNKEQNTVEVYSREGKPLHNHGHIDRAIMNAQIDSCVLDGELIADSFAETQKIVSTQTPHKDAHKVKFHVFDILSLDEWNNKKCVTPLRERKDRVFEVVDSIGDFDVVISVSYTIVTSSSHAEAYMAKMVSAGFEGIIIKKPNSYYEFAKTKIWQKLKPTADADLRIVGAVEGEHGAAGTLGALIVEGIANFGGNEYDVRSEVGTGFTAKDRVELWNQYRIGTLVGQIAEIRFQEVSQDQTTGKFSLRFPRYVRMRPDKTS